MTEPSRTTPPAAGSARANSAAARAPRPSRPGFLPTVALAVATFLVLFEFLAFQLWSGNDPALGAGTTVAAVAPARAATQPILKRRIIKTRVIEDPPTTSGSVASAGSSTSTTAPVTSSAPAPAAAAPAAAPAPAPAAAPVVTSTS